MDDDPFERAVEHERAERRRRRHRRARAVFRCHAVTFLAVNASLVLIWASVWAQDGRGEPWFLPTLLGWGIGLAAHYAMVRPALRPPRARP